MLINDFRLSKFFFFPSQKLYNICNLISLKKNKIFIRFPSFLTAYRRIAQGKYATLIILVRMNVGTSKLCTRSLKGHVVQCSLNLCCFGLSKISSEFREPKENPPFTFCSVCSILHAFFFLTQFLIEKKNFDRVTQK